MSGDSVDNAQIANLVKPQAHLTVNGMTLDMAKFTQACDRLGVNKGDVVSIGGYRNARGVMVPDYDTVRIEQKGTDDE